MVLTNVTMKERKTKNERKKKFEMEKKINNHRP